MTSLLSVVPLGQSAGLSCSGCKSISGVVIWGTVRGFIWNEAYWHSEKEKDLTCPFLQCFLIQAPLVWEQMINLFTKILFPRLAQLLQAGPSMERLVCLFYYPNPGGIVQG